METGSRTRADEKTVVRSFPSHYSARDVLQKITAINGEDAFYIVNLERLVFMYNQVRSSVDINAVTRLVRMAACYNIRKCIVNRQSVHVFYNY